ncbi:MAG: phosphoglycerate dehydrogenase [Gammaproteobacteria bacterium]|nr:phosphoglycerate dehydrogenase [Gammaproteobacteria bacterium]
MKKVLVADTIAAAGVEFLRQQPGLEIECHNGLAEADLCRRIADAHAVIVRSATTITATALEAARSLQVIGRAGIGVDNIDVARATECGIVVLNTPDANATTTAELTLAHILSLSRCLPQADRSLRAGEWQRSRFMGAELAGKTLGIVGYGTIGRIVAEMARSLRMRVIAHDPFVTPEVFEADGIESMGLDELVASVDYLTLHCPLNSKTRGLLGAARLRAMKRGARLINCARGGLVDERALHELLVSGHLAGAALDVFEQEPPTGSRLLQLDNVVATPHLGASTHEAQEAAGREIARQVAAYLHDGEPINAINLPQVSAEERVKLRPYLTLALRLGKLLAALVSAPIRQLEVSLYGDAAARDLRSITTEALIGVLSGNMSDTNRVNARHFAARHGIAIVEARCGEHPDYPATVVVKARHGDSSTVVEGTLLERRHPRLIRVGDYEIEAVLEGNLLLTRHRDQPGVIAAISTLLAQERINISRMQLGIVSGSDKAVAVIGISTLLEQELLHAIGRIPAISRVTQVSL